MENVTRITLGLDIYAQKMMQHIQLENDKIEKSIKNGIEKALIEIFENDNFENTVSELVKNELENAVKYACNDWALKNKIKEIINENISNKVDILSKEWSEKILKNLE